MVLAISCSKEAYDKKVQNKHSILLCTFILYFDIIAAENKCEQNMPILIRRKCGSL